VTDYKLFTPSQGLANDTLWYCEEIPGEIHMADVTEQLERGYWPSYNVPYFDDVYAKSGYKTALAYWTEKAGNDPKALQNLAQLGYQTAPRANIFRRDQGKVDDLEGMKWIMRENQYKTDPYSKGSPWNAICSRGDLAGSADGCYDGKITTMDLIGDRKAYAVNGPTTAGGTLPPFSWTGGFASDPHEGMPTTYNFTFELTQPDASV